MPIVMYTYYLSIKYQSIVRSSMRSYVYVYMYIYACVYALTSEGSVLSAYDFLISLSVA